MNEHNREKEMVDIHIIHRGIIPTVFILGFFSVVSMAIYIISLIVLIGLFRNISHIQLGWWSSLGFVVVQLAVIITAILLFLNWADLYYIILPTTFIVRRGIIDTKETSYSIFMIQTIYVEQGFWGKIFNYGDVLLNRGNPRQIVLSNVPNPFHWAHILRSHREKMGMQAPEQS